MVLYAGHSIATQVTTSVEIIPMEPLTTQTFRLTMVKYQSNKKVSDWYVIDIHLMCILDKPPMW